MDQLVRDYQETEWGRNVLTNYMIWRLLAAFYPDRPAEADDREERYIVRLTSITHNYVASMPKRPAIQLQFEPIRAI